MNSSDTPQKIVIDELPSTETNRSAIDSPQSLRPQSRQIVVDELPFAEANRSDIDSLDTPQKTVIDELPSTETNRSTIDSLDGSWWRIGSIRSWIKEFLDDNNTFEREDLDKPSSKQLTIHDKQEEEENKNERVNKYGEKVNKHGETKSEAAVHLGVDRLLGGILIAFMLVKIMGWI